MDAPTFVYGKDWLDRPVIIDAGPPVSEIHPLDGLHSHAQRAIILAPLTRGERELLRMSRGLDLNGRRVVVFWILSQRRAHYEQNREAELARAVQLRRMDDVEDERRRAERWCRSRATMAAKEHAAASAARPPGATPLMATTGLSPSSRPTVKRHPKRFRDRDRDR